MVARAVYAGRDNVWEIALMDGYAARFRARMSGGHPIGTIDGDFKLYDTEILEKHRLPRFFQLPKTFLTPTPSIHPSSYQIALRDSETGSLYEVEVLYERSMPHSEDLRFFFEIWRNIWRGVPGYPPAPGLYVG